MPSHAHAAPRATTRTRSYPGTPCQIHVVRADLRALLRDCPHADDIILCASELAANAAIHSLSAAPGGVFIVTADIRPGEHVRIEVRDHGGPWIQPAGDAERPHGLDLLGALATRWGITGTAADRTVWAQLDWPTP